MLTSDRPTIDKAPLMSWVSDFLWYWEDNGMQYGDAAEIIVNEILKALQGDNNIKIDQMPNPQSFFECQE